MAVEFIARQADQWPVVWMGEALEGSTSGYDAWTSRPDRPAQKRRQDLVGAIEEVQAEVKGRYGSPRMTPELKARGHECSENTVAKLMRTHGIRAKAPRRFVRTTDSTHRLPGAESLLDRNVDPEGPNEPWCADVTYVPTREGWLYLAVVEDLFSRMVVGWSMAETMESRLVGDALPMALARRRPGAGLVAHPDRGTQYASEHYPRVMGEEGIGCRMSGVGQCWDNAPMESFFGRLKCEVAPGEMFATRDRARAEIVEYPEVFYNRVRRHSSPGALSPVEFERTYNRSHR
ncbi:MAG: family transposase [Gemmataceae bacterium]|nr:family transposase [Gemmataceae bacterium]